MSTTIPQSSGATPKAFRTVVAIVLGALVLGGIAAAWISVTADDTAPIVMSQPGHPFQGGRKQPAHPTPTIAEQPDSLSPEAIKPGPALVPAAGAGDGVDNGRKGLHSPPRPGH